MYGTKLGFQEFYADIDKDFLVIPRHYVILNLTADIPFKLRVCTKIFHENTKYIEFY